MVVLAPLTLIVCYYFKSKLKIMSDTSKKEVYIWKGKMVKKKVYEHRLIQQQNGFKRRKVKATSNICDDSGEKVCEPAEKTRNDTADKGCEPAEQSLTNIGDKGCEPAEKTYAEGRRIVELKTLAEQLWCRSCKEALSLQFIENEIRRGLGSQLLIRCHNCLIINQICTSKYSQLDVDNRSVRFATNYKAVLGALHSGLGWTHLSKLFACLNIPCFSYETYQRYQKEIRKAAEKVLKKSCSDTAAFERKLTLEQIEEITKLLMETTDSNSLFPSRNSRNDASDVTNEESTSKNIDPLQQ